MDSYYIIFLYLELVNLAAFVMMGVDKHRAKTGRRRISEAALLTVAAVGGSIGALAGMYLFHHKTRKPRFFVGIPAILIGEVLFCLCLIYAVSV